jgi:hypothetical protein
MTTSTSPSLLDWILNLLRDASARSAFQADPSGYAAAHGFGDVSSADMHDALCVAVDCAPAHSDTAAHFPPPSHHHDDDHDHDHDHDHDRDHGHGGDGGDGAHYLKNYITNNYKIVETHDTYLDNSLHQHIDTDGGDFAQHIDNDPVLATGDGAVAAGDDIRDATITPGSGNVVGNDNHAVTGDDGTTAFGTGAANRADLGHASFGDGGSLSIGGDADGHSTENDTRTAVSNSGDGATSVNAAGADGHANHYADQHESDASHHASYEDDSRTDSHTALNSHNDGSYADSHDYDLHTHF